MRTSNHTSGSVPSRRRWRAATALAAAAAVALAGCGTPSGARSDDSDTLKVGIVTSQTGLLSAVGARWENGFMAGLEYLTDGTMEIDGKKIELLKGDDTGEASVGTTVAKKHLSEGARILVGPATSAVAVPVADLAIQNDVLFVSGGAGTTDLVGYDKRVFLTNGNSPAGTYVYKEFLGDDTDGKTMATVNQDYAFGQAQAREMKTMLEPEGITVNSTMLPLDTVDFSAVANKIRKDQPDYVHTNWIGAGQTQLYSALASQKALEGTTFFTTLFESAAWEGIGEALGDQVEDAHFAMMYYPHYDETEKAKFLLDYSKKKDHKVEDGDGAYGWSSAEMVYRALSEGDPSDTDSMVDALQDWTFEGPMGDVTIRGEDNQVIPPYAVVNLVKKDGAWDVELDHVVPSKDITPAVVKPLK
ncbi:MULTISPECIES: ABC transporter substrate-binding protein [unclassified Aeromicrobium]|uniref:ABC transporter substrate-binding protein n=1 Tax=unclassified Aeromicrobium TaxID=2633570 RepID=UPI00396B0950